MGGSSYFIHERIILLAKTYNLLAKFSNLLAKIKFYWRNPATYWRKSIFIGELEITRVFFHFSRHNQRIKKPSCLSKRVISKHYCKILSASRLNAGISFGSLLVTSWLQQTTTSLSMYFAPAYSISTRMDL